MGWLTVAQRAYLELADGGGLSLDAVSPGSSRRCVDRLVALDLVEERFILGEGTRFFITDAGRRALSEAMP